MITVRAMALQAARAAPDRDREYVALASLAETQLGLEPTPVTWPIGTGTDFQGVADRRDRSFWRFERTAHGAKAASEERFDADRLGEFGEVGLASAHDIELLDVVGADHDQKAVAQP